ncbi:MAG: hypothetical protein ABW212_05890, partial [Pseudonocardia sediminis]
MSEEPRSTVTTSSAPAGRPAEPPARPGIDDALVGRAVARVERWIRSTEAQGGGDGGPSARLAALMHDPAGVDFTMAFVDRVARPTDDRVAARELARLAGGGGGSTIPRFISGADRSLVRLGAVLAPRLPHVV